MYPPDSGQAVPKVNTPGACHKGISDTGELLSRIRSIFVEFNHQVERAISTPRFGTYRSEASSDDHAWALYRWNIHLAAAVVPLAADLEVALRNTIHDRLTDHFDRPDWWASTSLLLDDVTAEMLTEVVRKHQKEIIKRTVGPGKVIADTTLGVWVHLLGRGGIALSGGPSTTRRGSGGRHFASDSRKAHSRPLAGNDDQPEPRCTTAQHCFSGFATGLRITNRYSTASRSRVRPRLSLSATCGTGHSNCWHG